MRKVSSIWSFSTDVSRGERKNSNAMRVHLMAPLAANSALLTDAFRSLRRAFGAANRERYTAR